MGKTGNYDKESINPYGMDERYSKKWGEIKKEFYSDSSYSNSSYLRLVSLFFFFDVNMDCLFHDAAEMNEENKLKQDLFHDMLKSENNYLSVDKWYERLGKHLNKYNGFTCDKCLSDVISKAKDMICKDLECKYLECKNTECKYFKCKKKECNYFKCKKRKKKECKNTECKYPKDSKSKCQIVRNYNDFCNFFMEIFVLVFDCLKTDKNIQDLKIDENIQGNVDALKYLIAILILPDYNVKVPQDNEFIKALFIKGIEKLEKRFFDITLLENLYNVERLRKILSSFKRNWGIISKICKDKFLADKLSELTKKSPGDLDMIEEYLLQKIEESSTKLVFENAMEHAFLLNFDFNFNYLEKKDYVGTETIKKFFSKQYDTEKETVFFCYVITIQLAADPKNINRCLKLLFHYACIRR